MRNGFAVNCGDSERDGGEYSGSTNWNDINLNTSTRIVSALITA